MKKLTLFFVVLAFLTACSDDPTSPNGGGNNVTYNSVLKLDFNGTTYTAASSTNIYSEKRIFVNGLDASGNLLMDMDIPVGKDQVASNKAFKIEFDENFAQLILYINNDPYTLEGGVMNITKHANNRVSGTFSGTSYKMDYNQTPPVKGESATITNGVFTDLEVKE
ncbi:MAG: hypothetical protein RLZZ337_36 [Bacteroidota bacterium]|jgi:hypothetical protein